MANQRKKQKKYEIKCPACSERLIIEIEKEVVIEPVKGQYEEVVKVERDSQTELPDGKV